MHAPFSIVTVHVVLIIHNEPQKMNSGLSWFYPPCSHFHFSEVVKLDIVIIAEERDCALPQMVLLLWPTATTNSSTHSPKSPLKISCWYCRQFYSQSSSLLHQVLLNGQPHLSFGENVCLIQLITPISVFWFIADKNSKNNGCLINAVQKLLKAAYISTCIWQYRSKVYTSAIIINTGINDTNGGAWLPVWLNLFKHHCWLLNTKVFLPVCIQCIRFLIIFTFLLNYRTAYTIEDCMIL